MCEHERLQAGRSERTAAYAVIEYVLCSCGRIYEKETIAITHSIDVDYER